MGVHETGVKEAEGGLHEDGSPSQRSRMHRPWHGACVAGLVLLAAGPAARPADPGASSLPTPTAAEWLGRARDAQQRGLLKQALEFAGRAVEAAPGEPRVWHYRAGLHERLKDLRAAETDLTRLVDLLPQESAVWLDRGILRLRLGDYAGSVADLDRCAELRPAKAAELWQRGIALFYAGRFDEARRQFELHRTVNPGDVENSAWHYCCVARLEGAESARRRWLGVEGDSRLPMMGLQALYRGESTPEAVLAAVESALPETRRASGRFYAHLYLALYHGARNEKEAEVRHTTEATRLTAGQGIMGEIARLHADWVASGLRRKP